MCAVSVIGDDWKQRWPTEWPSALPPLEPSSIPNNIRQYVTQAEFQELHKLVLQMKRELEEARAQDIANNEPDCEMEDKVELLKAIATAMGVDLKGVFPNG